MKIGRDYGCVAMPTYTMRKVHSSCVILSPEKPERPFPMQKDGVWRFITEKHVYNATRASVYRHAPDLLGRPAKDWRSGFERLALDTLDPGALGRSFSLSLEMRLPLSMSIVTFANARPDREVLNDFVVACPDCAEFGR